MNSLWDREGQVIFFGGGELHLLLLSYFIYIIKVLLHIISTLARAIFYLHIVPSPYAKVESYQCDGVGGAVSESGHEATAGAPEYKVRRPSLETRMRTFGRC